MVNEVVTLFWSNWIHVIQNRHLIEYDEIVGIPVLGTVQLKLRVLNIIHRNRPFADRFGWAKVYRLLQNVEWEMQEF